MVKSSIPHKARKNKIGPVPGDGVLGPGGFLPPALLGAHKNFYIVCFLRLKSKFVIQKQEIQNEQLLPPPFLEKIGIKRFRKR